jgi:hypothetical protein
MPRPNQLGFCPCVNFLLGHISTCQLYKEPQSLLNPLNTRQLNKHISDFLSDHQRSNTKILRKVSRTFITETLTVSKIFKVPQIHINTKLKFNNSLGKSIESVTNSQRFIKNLHHRVRTFAIQAPKCDHEGFEARRRVTEAIVNQ